MKRKSYLIVVLLCSFTFVFAQKKAPAIKAYSEDEMGDAKKQAAAYFKALNYIQAQAMYERLVATDPKDVDFSYKLALIYMYTNTAKAKAVPLMEYVVNANSKNIPKDAQFDLARAYHYAGLFDKALETYEKYREEKKLPEFKADVSETGTVASVEIEGKTYFGLSSRLSPESLP